MSLIPKLVSHWWETLEQPHRLLDQNFGMPLRPEQFFSHPFFERPSLMDSRLPGWPVRGNYYRPWADLMRDEESGWSVVKNDKDKFHVALDVQQFKPDEVKVKLVDNYIVVEGQHEEKQDDHGMVSRHFIRKYMVPEQCDPEKVSTTLSSDGILTITAPRKPESLQAKQEKPIEITHTGKPALKE